MNFERLAEVASSNKKGSVNLAKLFARSAVVSNDIEVKRLRAKTELFEQRKKTYTAIQQSSKEQDEKDSVLGKVLGGLGLAGLAKGLRGAKRAPTAVVSPRPRAGRMPGIGRGAVGLNVLYGGIDFMQRKGAGQTNLQAGIGAGAGVAGGLAGMAAGGKLGALIGTAIAPGVGTLVGGGLGSLIGGGIGAMAAGNLADRATGVDTGEAEIDRRLQEEEKRTALLITKTPFSGALDTFDGVLDKLASFEGGICACAGMIEPPGSAAISVPKDKINEAYSDGYAKGLGEGRKQGGVAGAVAGFTAAVVVIGGVMFLTRGKGGPILQRIGTVADVVGTVRQTAPKVTPRTPITPRQIRAQEPQLPARPTPKPAPETPVPTRAQRIQKTIREATEGKPQKELVEEVIQTPEGPVILRRTVKSAEKTSGEEFFERGVQKGVNKYEKFIRKRTTPIEEQISPTGPQSSAGGESMIIAAEPNTTIVPVPVGGGGGVVMGGGGATPYQAATKYAQIMSQITA